MNRYRSERGATLIMMIGVMAVLAVLAATLVMVTVNVKGSTKDVTTRSQAFNVAEAGLDLGMYTLSSAWPTSTVATGTVVALSTDPRTMFDTSQFPTSSGKQFITVTMSPDTSSDHLLLQAQANVGGKSVRLQTQIVRKNVGVKSLVPGVAVYSGSDTAISGNPFVGSPLNNGVPTGAVYVYGNAAISGSPDLSTVGIKVRGALDVTGKPAFSSVKTQNDPSVPTFDQFLSPTDIDALTQQAKATQPEPAGVVIVGNNGNIPDTATVPSCWASCT
jgi:Tfp pilus assembly protein PilX